MTLCDYLSPQFESPLILVDVGARMGIDPRWLMLGENFKAYCFEADPIECERLNNLDSRVVFIPLALGKEGKQTLYKTRLDESTGLYKTNSQFFNRLLNRENAEVIEEIQIDVTTLDKARQLHSIPKPDFIKLDVEGAELDILTRADLDGTFGVFSEFRFHKEINGCHTFADLDTYMNYRKFMLYDILIGRQSRKALPFRGAILNDKNGKRWYGGTQGGQTMDGDALYFRDPMKLKLTKDQLLKIACLFYMFNLHDCAAEILLDRGEKLGIDVDHCLDLLAGGSYKVYMETY